MTMNAMIFSPILQMSDDLRAKFFHESVDDMIGKREMCYENYNNSSDIEWTKGDYNSTKECIQNLYRRSLLNDSFELDSHLPKDFQEAMQNCFQIRKNDIFQALAKEAVLKNGNMLVENIDWKLKWILGSSDLATIREPLLQVSLHCIRKINEKNEQNTVNVEVDLNQVDHLIKKLSELKEDQILETSNTNIETN